VQTADDDIRAPAPPAVTLSHDDIATAPQIATDAFRAVARVPGVASSDLSAGFRVRGGDNREVLLTFDGVELYDPFHLEDFDGALSIIDPEIVGRASLSTGGFGAQYGNHLTGVFDLRSRESTLARGRTVLGASLSGASILHEAPLAHGRANWLVSVRRGFLGAALSLTGEGKELSPRYGDGYARLRVRPSGHDELTLSVLRAGDVLHYDAPDAPSLASSYRSRYAWLTWRTALSPAITGRTIVSRSAVYRHREGADSYGGEPTLNVRDDRAFEVLGMTQDWTFALGARAELDAGAQVQRVSARYDYDRWQMRPHVASARWIRSTQAMHTTLSPSGTTVGAYLSQRVQATRALTVEGGVRYDRQSYTHDPTISPRLAVMYALGERTTLRASWGRYAQPQRLDELQVPDGVEQIGVTERAEHRIAGIEHRTAGGVRLRLDAYDRRLRRIAPRYVNLDGSLEVFPEAASDRVLLAPTSGDARGIELSAGSTRGAVQWSASYALAAAHDVVDGRRVPHAYDQRHTVLLDASVHPWRGWSVSAAWQYHSGWPVTPVHFLVDTLSDGTYHVRTQFGAPYAGRLAPYHRLDVRVSNDRTVGATRLSIYVDVFNVYDRDNPRGLGYTVADWNAGTVTVAPRRMAQLPLLPTLGVRWTF
ncbi:MAG: TonB-dependent receptor, partial [Gemmatimonadaceae bacterium]|nr:TonB-dependent receptor [Gemmatimonadaceae bacterium]